MERKLSKLEKSTENAHPEAWYFDLAVEIQINSATESAHVFIHLDQSFGLRNQEVSETMYNLDYGLTVILLGKMKRCQDS